MGDSSDYYATHYNKTLKFTAYNVTFEPDCKCNQPYSYGEHEFHKKGDHAANTTNDILRTIWDILKHQAKWLTEKMESLNNVDVLAKAISESLKGFFKDTIRNAISESLEGRSQPQGDLEKHTQTVKDAVANASKEIGNQNSEILGKLSGIKEEIERSLNDPNFDDKFGHTEKVIQDCIADVEIRISKLQRLGRDILEQVSDSSGKTDIEKLALENNKILKELKEGNVDRPEQEKLLEKLGEQQKMFDNIFSDGKREILETLKEISDKLGRASMDQQIAEELAKAKEHLDKASREIHAPK